MHQLWIPAATQLRQFFLSKVQAAIHKCGGRATYLPTYIHSLASGSAVGEGLAIKPFASVVSKHCSRGSLCWVGPELQTCTKHRRAVRVAADQLHRQDGYACWHSLLPDTHCCR